ncbi:SA1002 family membrane protein [Staphylococcus agnetis]|uniref:Uncharacterized protein n=2 Tax=Staphylococcus agnetis TaxID=985762 RepID=A0ABD7TUZ0_9STAP|nr:hypothetical protein [Staphylococcus agnetis]PTH59438.1 hypothetical protein BU584_01515 [Staphylococcus agnetis]UXU55322.1 hypothetical protein MUA11_02000 [Staphylococcus agnetis]UXU57594.1 hypothetical protein MUA95_01945 [Staphylococcus agnetis]UXU64575.1 hypothetical protein MUA84_01950 [Staphylococcus agnetis]UXU66916.1 hypothetical protein MUA52_01950 [Staphylococcus agnetis]
MLLINTLIILSLFLLIGFLVGHEEGKLVFIKAIAIGTLLIFLSYITILIGSFAVWLPMVLFFDITDGIFQIGLITMLLSGIIQYIFLKFMSRKIVISDTLIQILEYFIQWLLIYFTLYQFVANQLKGLSDIDVQKIFSNLLTVDSINIFILPSLLVSWISISMVRMSRKQLKDH